MRTPTLLAALAAATTATAAAETTVGFFIPFLEGAVEASVVEVNKAVTTYVIRCPKGAEMENCGLNTAGLTYIDYSSKSMSHHIEEVNDGTS